MKKTLTYLFAIAVVVSVMVGTFNKADSRSKSSLPTDRSGGPKDSINGTPTGATCWNGCHNTIGTGAFTRAGWITSDVPASGYVPGATYNITVSNNSKGYKHGFEASCQTAAGVFMGTLLKNDSTWIINGTGVEAAKSWITQRDSTNAVQNAPPIPCMLGSIGTGGWSPNFNSRSWTFKWIAPAAGSGNVSFYMATVATNGNESDNGLYDGNTWKGDSVFTSNLPLTENTTLNFTNIVRPTCSPNTNGSAQLNPTYGTPPYTYLWTPTAQTTNAATGLGAGVYTVVVTDAVSSSRTLYLTLQNAFNASVTTQTVPTCPGGIGVATCTPTGGTSPYTYAWTPTGSTANTASVNTPATLAVTASDNAGCTAIAQATMVDQYSPFDLFTFPWNVTNITCNGANNGYAKTGKLGGGTVTYLWNTVPTQTTSSVNNLQPGTWKCVATGTCPGAKDSIYVTITEPTIIVPTISYQNNGCNNANNGSAAVSATGGYTPYTYSWSTTPIQTTATATGLAPGTYTCSVYGAAILSGVAAPPACFQTTVVTITNPPGITASIGSQTNVNCFGNTTGAATVTASGGASPLTYLWSSGGTTTSISAVAAGNYTLTITDANLCTQTQAVTITQPTAALATSVGSQTNVNCFGANTGAASVNATGGTSGYTYLWSVGGTTSSLSNLTAGTYAVTVTDANACTQIQAVTITQPGTALAAHAGSNVSICNGNSTTIGGSPSATGGTTPYTYSWNPTTALTSAIIANPVANPTTSTTYTLNLTDGNGCTSNSGVTVTLYPTTTVPTLTTGHDTLYSTAAVSYQWYFNNAIINGATSNYYRYTQIGSYKVIVTDANGCTAVSSPFIWTSANEMQAAADKFNVYPNPAKDELNIVSGFNGSTYIDIVDLYGRVVISQYLLVNDNTNTISLKSLNAGMYLIRISNNEISAVKRFTKLSDN